jgi:hypothetical protein
MFIIKHFMNLHPEYNGMLMDFYAKLHDKCPIDVNEVLWDSQGNADDSGIELDEMIWELGLSLPSWEDDSTDQKQ